jgi:hypothetical protein
MLSDEGTPDHSTCEKPALQINDSTLLETMPSCWRSPAVRKLSCQRPDRGTRIGARHGIKYKEKNRGRLARQKSPEQEMFSMPRNDLLASMPAEAQELMKTTLLRINTSLSLRKIRQALFTEPERKSLGKHLQAACTAHNGADGMWCKLHRGCSRPRAIIELGKQLNFLDDFSYQWLLREAGEKRGPRVGNWPD